MPGYSTTTGENQSTPAMGTMTSLYRKLVTIGAGFTVTGIDFSLFWGGEATAASMGLATSPPEQPLLLQWGICFGASGFTPPALLTNPDATSLLWRIDAVDSPFNNVVPAATSWQSGAGVVWRVRLRYQFRVTAATDFGFQAGNGAATTQTFTFLAAMRVYWALPASWSRRSAQLARSIASNPSPEGTPRASHPRLGQSRPARGGPARALLAGNRRRNLGDKSSHEHYGDVDARRNPGHDQQQGAVRQLRREQVLDLPAERAPSAHQFASGVLALRPGDHIGVHHGQPLTAEGTKSWWGPCGARHVSARPCSNVLDFGQLVLRCGVQGCLLDMLGSEEFEARFQQPPAAEDIPRPGGKRPRPQPPR